jgi:hypothetical protein
VSEAPAQVIDADTRLEDVLLPASFRPVWGKGGEWMLVSGTAATFVLAAILGWSASLIPLSAAAPNWALALTALIILVCAVTTCGITGCVMAIMWRRIEVDSKRDTLRRQWFDASPEVMELARIVAARDGSKVEGVQGASGTRQVRFPEIWAQRERRGSWVFQPGSKIEVKRLGVVTQHLEDLLADLGLMHLHQSGGIPKGPAGRSPSFFRNQSSREPAEFCRATNQAGRDALLLSGPRPPHPI